jgi:putative colanic acid biosynthesis UDP-glucose lipid carrier transferase
MKSNCHFHRSILWFIDWILLNLSILSVLYFLPFKLSFDQNGDFVLFAWYNFSWIVSVFLNKVYLSSNWFDFKRYFSATFKSVLLFYCLTGLLYLFNTPYFSSLLLFWSLFVFVVVLLIHRLTFQMLIKLVGVIWHKRVVIIGNNESANKLSAYFKSEPQLFNLIATFSKVVPERLSNQSNQSDILNDVNFPDEMQENALVSGTSFNGVEAVGNVLYPSFLAPQSELDFPVQKTFNKQPFYQLDEISISDCLDYIEQYQVTELYCTLSPETYPFLYQLARKAEERFVLFKFVADFNQMVNNGKWVEQYKDLPLITMRPHPLAIVSNLIQKRLFDIVFSTIVIVGILSWLTPILAVLIALESHGPIFFTQLRSGKNNKSFWCIKFRTLRVNKESDNIQVTKNDSRITKLGKFLRKSNIDELPQFLNVWMGDMSVVGPRPHMLKHTSAFNALEEDYMVRHFVKPGITGLAQINGFRGEIRHPDLLKKRLEKDLAYMENWSMLLDLEIIFKTIFVSIKGDINAY